MMLFLCFLDVVVVQFEYTAKNEKELSLRVGLLSHNLISPMLYNVFWNFLVLALGF